MAHHESAKEMISVVHSTSIAATVTLVFLVCVEVCAMHGFHVFAQGTWVSVALSAAASLAHVRLLQAQTDKCSREPCTRTASTHKCNTWKKEI